MGGQRLGVALVGGGFMGKAHSLAYALAPIASDIGATVQKSVMVDATPELAAQRADELGWSKSSADWHEVLDRDDIDIVDICTPPQFHAEIAMAALRAGKHVFCEKPISNSAAEAVAMAAVAAEHPELKTQVGFNYRHTPAVSFAKQTLDSGRLGVPMQLRASYLQESAFWADPHRWRALKATGGSGMIGDIGSHIIDLSELMFGDIVRVASRVRSKAPGIEDGWLPEETRVGDDLVDDAAVWVAEFANGAIGSFAINAFSSGRKNRVYLELDASKGAVEFNWNEREEFKVSYVEEPLDHQGFRTIHTNDQHPDGWWRLAGLGTGYVEVSAIQFQKFVRAIVQDTPTSPDFARAAHIQQVVETVDAASTRNEWVDVPALVPVTAR
jgi:predicted dehydrogenase